MDGEIPIVQCKACGRHFEGRIALRGAYNELEAERVKAGQSKLLELVGGKLMGRAVMFCPYCGRLLEEGRKD